MLTKAFINNIGNDITGSKNLQEALEKGGLNWTAKSAPVEYHGDSEAVLFAGNHKVVYKDSDQSDRKSVV